MRNAAVCHQHQLIREENKGGGDGDAHVRWVTRELEELLDAAARSGNIVRVRVALLELANARDNLVESQCGLIAEAEELRDSIKAG